MSLADRISLGVKATLVSQLVFIVSTGALMVILTRYLLTANEYGLLYLALSVLGVVRVFASLGLPKSAARYVTNFLETNPGQVRHVIRRSLTYLLVASVLSGLLVFLARDPIATYLSEPSLRPMLALGVVFVVLSTVTVYLRISFQAFNRVYWSAVVRIIESVGRFAFTIALVVVGLGAFGALLGYVAGLGIAAVVGLVIFYRRFYAPLPADDPPESGLSRRILGYSIPLIGVNAANILDTKFDALLVGWIVNTTAVGHYVLARQIVDFTVTPATSLGFTLSPTLAEQEANDHVEGAARLYETSLLYVLAMYVPAGVGLALVARPAIRHIFGADYLGAVPVLQVFGAFVVIRAVAKITSNSLDYLGLAGPRAVSQGVLAVLNVALNLLLIPIWGAAGAAVATVITNGAYTVVNVYFIHSKLTLDLGRLTRRLGVIAAVTLAMALAVFEFRSVISGVPSLFGVVALGVAIWAALAAATGLVDFRRLGSLLT